MMKVYKMIRITAWILVLAAVVSLFSGLVLIKPGLFPRVNYQLASWLHLIFGVFIFAPLFYLHSSAGIFLMLARFPKLNKRFIKIPALILWALILASVIIIYFIPNPTPAKIGGNLLDQPSSAAVGLDLSEVGKHNTANDCWMIISNKVYNLTSYVNSHPGGAAAMVKYCGKDGSVGFATKDKGSSHSATAANLLSSYYLGDVGQTVSGKQIQNINIQAPPARISGEDENEDEFEDD